MATIDLTNWDEKNTANPVDSGSNADYSGSTLQKVAAVKVTWNNASSGTGAGDCEFTTSNVSAQDDLVVTESDESTTRAYEVAFFDTGNNVAWLWVYGSWSLDGTDQIVVGAGTGDGTDYSSPNNATGTNGTGNNPWGQTGINALAAWHLNESSGTTVDSSTNSFDSTSTTGTVFGNDGQFGDARGFDNNDDGILFNSLSGLDIGDDSNFTIAIWQKTTETERGAWFDQRDSGFTGIALQKNGDSADGNSHPFFINPNGTNVEGTTSMKDGNWHNVIGYRDGSNAGLIVDGTEEDTSSDWSDADSSDNDTVLGNQSGGSDDIDGSNPFGGDLDAVRVFSDSKGADWWQAEYDLSPVGGQDFFSWSGAQDATAVVTQTVNDSLNFSETTNTTLAFTASDSLAMQEQTAGTLADTLSDNISFAENIQSTLSDTLTDSLEFTENETGKLIDTITDSLTFTENTVAKLALTVIVTDSLTFGENIDSELRSTLQEQLGFTENTESTLSDTLTDSLAFTESSTVAIMETLQDQLDFNENVAAAIAATFTDSLAFQEQVVSQLQSTVTEDLSFQETVTAALAARATDQLTFSENLESALAQTLQDQLDFNENVTAVISDTLTDSLTLSEQVVFASLLNINAPTKALITTKDKFAVMSQHTFTEGDLGDELDATLEDEDGAIDLSNAKRVELDVKNRSGTKVFDGKTISITDASNGKVSYNWSSGDFIETAGVYRAKFKIIDNNSESESVPNDGAVTIEIEEEVG